MKDTSKHQGLRNQLANVLKKKGIINENVLNAVKKIPRHLFIDSSFADHAYQDKAFPIAAEQTISQPYIVAKMTEHLISHTSKRGRVMNKILEIGSGCGYQSAVLSYFADEICAVERVKPLVMKSRENLRELGIRNILIKHADGFEGWGESVKFDGIICAAAPREYPKELLELLEINGKLVIPVGLEGHQKLYVITKTSETEHEEVIHEDVAFVPMLPGTSKGAV